MHITTNHERKRNPNYLGKSHNWIDSHSKKPYMELKYACKTTGGMYIYRKCSIMLPQSDECRYEFTKLITGNSNKLVLEVRSLHV